MRGWGLPPPGLAPGGGPLFCDRAQLGRAPVSADWASGLEALGPRGGRTYPLRRTLDPPICTKQGSLPPSRALNVTVRLGLIHR